MKIRYLGVFLLLCSFSIVACSSTEKSTPIINNFPEPPAQKQPTISKQTPSQKQMNLVPSPNLWTKVQLNQNEMEKIQTSADQGHSTSYMDPITVALDFSNKTTNLKEFSSGQLDDSLLKTDQVIQFTKNQKTLLLHVFQPEKQGRGGIWVIDRYIIR